MYLHKRKAKGEHEDVFKYFLLREVKKKRGGVDSYPLGAPFKST